MCVGDGCKVRDDYLSEPTAATFYEFLLDDSMVGPIVHVIPGWFL